MCGIAGILFGGDPEDCARIQAMTEIQAHRGPNGGQWSDFPGAWFGHRRLSIIDLNTRADQPMVSQCGRYVLVFNGEIYNYRELRQDLIGSGQTFVTQSDTEVLLVALCVWGEAALDRLVGMYAFCFYDIEQRCALFARDPFGQKPLNFARRPDGAFLFASEIKALLAGGIVAQPNQATWARYLLHARYDDQADTVFAGVEQLLPGELMRVSADSEVRRRWYVLSERVHLSERLTTAETADRLRALLVDAAKLHMRADVPVGVSLSGGLDSSTLLACLDLGGVMTPDLSCLSVDFGGDLSEAEWINAAAGHHGLTASISEFSAEDFQNSLAPTVWNLEAPLGGLMNCAMNTVMAQARDAGIPVLLDGTGLDEAFGGYRNHHDLYVGMAMRDQDPEITRILKEYAANWNVSVEEAQRCGAQAFGSAVTAIDGTVPIRPELISEHMKSRDEGLCPGPSIGDPLHDALASYLHVEKIPRNTRMKDRLSMAYGVELRLPFLDHRLIEFGLSLPADLMFLYGRSKSILREAMAGAMDDDVRLARKRSIQAPQGLWLRQEPMRSFVSDLIYSRSFVERGLFDASACHKAFERFCTGVDANSFFVWQWVNAELWFRTFIDGDATQVSLNRR